MLRRRGLPRPGGLVESKGAGDYVTAADRESEAAIVEVLERQTPGVAILAEEAGGVRAGACWVVDPLDGTTNFTHGFPVVGISIGLIDGGIPQLGVIMGPFLDLEFAGEQGHGATLNGQPLPRLGPGLPERAVVATGFPFRRKHRLARYQPVLLSALDRFEDLRRAGAAALDLAWTAAGTLDGFFELGLGTWDFVAGAALILELGGRVSDWEGGPGWLETGDVLAGPAAVHETLLELASQAPPG